MRLVPFNRHKFLSYDNGKECNKWEKMRYTEDFKRDTVKLALEGDKSQAQSAIDFWVSTHKRFISGFINTAVTIY